MPFCSKCGASMEGNFCSKCGASTEPGAAPPQPQTQASAGISENAASALCYVVGLITGIIFLLIAPYNQNKTIRFHAFQSIFLNVAWILVWIALGILLPFGVEVFVMPLLSLGFVALWIYMIVKAYQNQKVRLPVIGDLAEKQA